jgi:hypothetical protein
VSVRVGNNRLVTWYGRGYNPVWNILPWKDVIHAQLTSAGFTYIRINTDSSHLIISAISPANNTSFPTDYFVAVKFEGTARQAGWIINATEKVVVAGSPYNTTPLPTPQPTPAPTPTPTTPPSNTNNNNNDPEPDEPGILDALKKEYFGIPLYYFLLGGVVVVIALKD